MQCTRASPHRDSGTMSGLENSTELFNDLRSQQFLPEIITSFHHDSCPERDSDKNGGKKCTLHRPGKKRRKQKTHAVVGFTGGKKKSLFSGNGTAAEKPKGWEAAVLLRSTEIHWVQASFSLQLA